MPAPSFCLETDAPSWGGARADRAARDHAERRSPVEAARSASHGNEQLGYRRCPGIAAARSDAFRPACQAKKGERWAAFRSIPAITSLTRGSFVPRPTRTACDGCCARVRVPGVVRRSWSACMACTSPCIAPPSACQSQSTRYISARLQASDHVVWHPARSAHASSASGTKLLHFCLQSVSHRHHLRLLGVHLGAPDPRMMTRLVG